MFPTHDELFNLMLLRAATGSKSVEDTVTGNPVTFLTDLAKPLKSLVANFLPIQASGTPSPENILPITGWSGLSVWNISGDFIRCTRTTSQETNGLKYTPIIGSDMKPIGFNVNGARTGSNSFYNLFGNQADTIPVGTYKVSGYTANVAIRVYATIEGNESKLFDSGSGDTSFTVTEEMTRAWPRLQILSPLNESINETVYPIIMSADSSVTVYPVAFPSTVYGGTLDIVSGLLTIDRKRVLISDIEWSYNENGYFYAVIADKVETKTSGDGTTYPVFCSMLAYGGVKTASQFVDGGIYQTYYSKSLYIKDSECTTFEELSEKYGTAEIVYCLSSPQTVQLTPQQINAIKGNNTLWSNANGNLEVTYMKKG